MDYKIILIPYLRCKRQSWITKFLVSISGPQYCYYSCFTNVFNFCYSITILCFGSCLFTLFILKNSAYCNISAITTDI